MLNADVVRNMAYFFATSTPRLPMNIRLAAALSIVVVLGVAVTKPKPARYVYVWSGTGNMKHKGMDMLAVIDADPASPRYATVIDVLNVDTAGVMPHHSELELPAKSPLFVNDYGASQSYMIDFKDPAHPKLAGKVADVPHTRLPHSFARLPNGNVVGTIQFGDKTVEGDPGGLAEFDLNGKLLRYTTSQDPAMPGAHIRTYALTMLPKIDRIVTTSSPMDPSERTADVVQVWRMSDLKLIKTVQVPEVATDSADMYPFELKTLADGKSVLINTYNCGFYHLTGIENNPKIERVMVMELPKNVGCSVPIIEGKYMVMPIAYAHRYATIDISDPAHPREVASLATDSTFFPHWISRDPGSDRVIVTDQGDGPPVVRLGRFNATTGKLTWDDRFNLSFHHVEWPNGYKGMVMPHGAVFVP